VSDKIRRQLFRAIRDNFRQMDEPGYFAVNFEVTGTVDHPKSNLMDKLIGRDLKDLGSVINSFMGGGKSEQKKQKTAKTPAGESEPSPTPDVEASPSPGVPTEALSPQPTPSP